MLPSLQRLYQKLVVAGTSSAAPATSMPHNTEQIRNAIKVVQCNKTRLTRDSLYNIHELAYDVNFIQHITTFPRLSVILHQSVCVNRAEPEHETKKTSGAQWEVAER